MDSAEVKLTELGYRQDLRRILSRLGNLAIALSLGSILSGVSASFSIGYSHGGPALMVWAWILHSILVLTVAFAMAELCSSIPTAGSLFNWSYHWGGRHRRFWCWITGWLNLMSYVAGTASSAFACALTISTMVVISGGGAYGGGRTLTPAELLGVIAAILVAQGAINLLSTRLLAVVNSISVMWNIAGTFALIVLLPSVATKRQNASFVFTHFDRQGYGYQISDGYTAMIGFLFAVYALSGMDSASHMAEETKSADRAAAKNIIVTMIVNSLLGFGLILAILFNMQETSASTLVTGQAGGFTIAQILYDIFASRYGTGKGAVAALTILVVAFFLCGNASVLITSRILWAFSREGALPLSPIWRKVYQGTGAPVGAVLASAALSILIALPLLVSEVAFNGCISIAVLGGATAYMIPIALRIFVARPGFIPGPINLGRWSVFVHSGAAAYLLFVCAAAVMPTRYPIDRTTLNYSPIAFGIVVVASVTTWFFPGKRGAHWWFAVHPGNLDTLELTDAATAAPVAKMEAP